MRKSGSAIAYAPNLNFSATKIKFYVKACNLRLDSFMPLRKNLFIKVMTLIFTTILL